MREFKFRIWDTELKRMMIEEEAHYRKIWLNGKFADHYFHEVGILMQYTGLKDENGKEIYEGDIVARDDMLYKRKVIYCPIRVAFILKKDDIETYFNFAFSYIVLGNIYENPELMEGEE